MARFYFRIIGGSFRFHRVLPKSTCRWLILPSSGRYSENQLQNWMWKILPAALHSRKKWNFKSEPFIQWDQCCASSDLSHPDSSPKPDLSPLFLAMKMWQIGYGEDFRKQNLWIYKEQLAFFGKFCVPFYWFGKFNKVFLYFCSIFSFANQLMFSHI